MVCSVRSVFQEERLVDFRLPVFFLFLVVRRAAHRAARITAKLAECAISAWILLLLILVHVLFYIISGGVHWGRLKGETKTGLQPHILPVQT